jgi:hypothetical protein
MNNYLKQLRADNEFIFRVFDHLDILYNQYGDGTADSYFEKMKQLQHIENIELSASLAGAIRMILEDAEIQKLHENIYKITHPGIDIINVDENEIVRTSLFDLNDTQLINYFALFCRTVTVNEHDGLVLLKYSPVIYETGWNKLALLCRGKVIEMNTGRIVSYPYDKFFNINENENYRASLIAELMDEAKDIIVTDKKDGSLIAVSRMQNGKLLVTTNGSFDNMHIDLAKDMIKNQYPLFYNNAEYCKTYIFEIVHPDDKHCISYGDTKKMFLHGVRNLNDYSLLSYDDMQIIAEKYELDLIEREYLDLDSMQAKVHELNANKEGWVVRIVGYDGSEKIVKIKYDEYFMIHRLRCGVNVKKIYNHYVFEQDIQDMLSLMPADIKDATLSVIEEINISRQKIAKRVEDVAIIIGNKANVPLGLELTREEKRRFYDASQTLKNTPEWPFVHLALTYSARGSVEWNLAHLPYDKYTILTESV